MSYETEQIELESALQVARDARARFEETHSAQDFRNWRDASLVAIKWSRLWLSDRKADQAGRDELEEILDS